MQPWESGLLCAFSLILLVVLPGLWIEMPFMSPVLSLASQLCYSPDVYVHCVSACCLVAILNSSCQNLSSPLSLVATSKTLGPSFSILCPLWCCSSHCLCSVMLVLVHFTVLPRSGWVHAHSPSSLQMETGRQIMSFEARLGYILTPCLF